MKKYVLMAGHIWSMTDHDTHFIPAHKLCQLYNLKPEECFFCDETKPETYLGLRLEDLIVLYPRQDGDYKKRVYA